MTDVAGELWMDANTPLVRILRQDGRLLRLASYEHSYPHCWRCRNPLIYKAVSSWFVRVTAIKDRLIENNEQITWVPENVKHGQFGKWLEGARDWSISRNRYWGSPIPVWKSDDPEYPRVDVYGSLDEHRAGLRPTAAQLRRRGRSAPSVHRRPHPARIPTTRPAASTMRRIEDVLDVWFDSASMPYAQVHYPFENHEWFDEHSPADFIVEYIGQTRGWFYVMHVLSTALFDRPAFTGVSCHGIVLGSDGQKMSKSLRNYPDVSEVFDRDGSDAMRWFLMASSVLRGGNLVVTEEGIRQGVREFLLPLWNAWYFFSTYANARRPAAGGAGYEATWRTDSTDVLDRYILALTGDLVRGVAADMDGLDSTMAAAKLRDFGEALTNWYIRRSRDRFWVGVTDDPKSREAFDTLYTVLETLTRVAAPLIPLVSERVWQGLTGGRSVHLEDWPDADAFPAADDIRSAMDAVREVSSVANALRKREGGACACRSPASRWSCRMPRPSRSSRTSCARSSTSRPSSSSISRSTPRRATASPTGSRSTPARPGPRLGKQVQQAIQAAKAGDWSERDGVVTAGTIALEPGEYELVLETTGRPEGEALAVLPRWRFRAARHDLDARAGGGGPCTRRHPGGAGHPEGGRLRRQRPHPTGARVPLGDRRRGRRLGLRDRRRRGGDPRAGVRGHGLRRRHAARTRRRVAQPRRREPTTPQSSRRARSPTRATSPSR